MRFHVGIWVHSHGEDNVVHPWNRSLFFPGDSESPSGVFLFSERVEEVEENFPLQDLMLKR